MKQKKSKPSGYVGISVPNVCTFCDPPLPYIHFDVQSAVPVLKISDSTIEMGFACFYYYKKQRGAIPQRVVSSSKNNNNARTRATCATETQLLLHCATAQRGIFSAAPKVRKQPPTMASPPPISSRLTDLL